MTQYWLVVYKNVQNFLKKCQHYKQKIFYLYKSVILGKPGFLWQSYQSLHDVSHKSNIGLLWLILTNSYIFNVNSRNLIQHILESYLPATVLFFYTISLAVGFGAWLTLLIGRKILGKQTKIAKLKLLKFNWTETC